MSDCLSGTRGRKGKRFPRHIREVGLSARLFRY